jgi:hypothetical protein
MIADQSLDHRPTEQARSRDRGASDNIEQQGPEHGSQPLVHRYIEAFFLPRKHGARQLIAHQLSQNEFEGRAPKLQIVWQAGSELDNTVIEKRWTHFERMRHAHPIGLIENVVRQVIALIRQEKIAVAEAWRIRKKLRLQETAALFARESAVPEHMSLIRRKEGSRQQAFDLVLEPDLFIGNWKQV